MKTIGRIDKADFPELSLKDINLKVDTGAYTSSIHCNHIKEVEENGKKHIEFNLLDRSYPQYKTRVFKAENYDTKTVKSSFGNVEQRFIIKTFIILFNKKYSINLSLSERSDMKYPILLGRRFINKKFVVDTSQKNLSFQQKEN